MSRLLEGGLPGGRGLDLGCGDGLLTRIILEHTGPRDLVGVDPDPAEVEQARALGIYSALHASGGDAVPEPDGSFDWILSNSVLEHIPDLDPVLREAGRLLAPGGRLIFTVPGPDFHACLRGPLGGAGRETYLARLDRRLAHQRYWGRADWDAALAPHDMRVTEAAEYLTERELRRWEWISRLTAGVLYGLAGRRRQPIEIQRSLGMRRAGARLPSPLARSMAVFLSAGLNGGVPPARFGCLLVIAAKSAT